MMKEGGRKETKKSSWCRGTEGKERREGKESIYYYVCDMRKMMGALGVCGQGRKGERHMRCETFRF